MSYSGEDHGDASVYELMGTAGKWENDGLLFDISLQWPHFALFVGRFPITLLPLRGGACHQTSLMTLLCLGKQRRRALYRADLS